MAGTDYITNTPLFGRQLDIVASKTRASSASGCRQVLVAEQMRATRSLGAIVSVLVNCLHINFSVNFFGNFCFQLVNCVLSIIKLENRPTSEHDRVLSLLPPVRMLSPATGEK